MQRHNFHEKNCLNNKQNEIVNENRISHQLIQNLIQKSEKKIYRIESQTTNAQTNQSITSFNEENQEHLQIYEQLTSPCSFAPRLSNKSFSTVSENSTGFISQIIDYNEFQELQNYEFQETIGHGSFGEVFRAIFKPLNLQIAVKIIDCSNYDEDFQLQLQQLMKSEKLVCAKMAKNYEKYNFLPKTYAVFQKQHCMYIVTELFHGFTLQNLLDYQQLSSSQIKYYLACILLAIKQMHETLSSIHRDIKPDNIMILANGTIKLIDFGCSKELGPQIKTSSLIGTYQYFSPQRFQEHYGKQADIWAFAVIAYEMVIGKLPFSFSGMNQCDQNQKFMRLKKIVKKRNVKNLQLQDIDKDLKQLIEGIYNSNRTERQMKWTIPYIQRLKYFQGILWNNSKLLQYSAPVTFSLSQIKKIKNKE